MADKEWKYSYNRGNVYCNNKRREGFALRMEQDTRSSIAKDKNINNAVLAGIVKAIPVVLGYLTVGFAYGVLARNAGLSVFFTVLMSLLVYAGSAQLISVSFFAASANPLTIILTTFIVNIRHLLMAAAMVPHLEGWRPLQKVAFGLELTDETFGLHSVGFSEGKPDKSTVFAINITSQLAWISGSLLGAVLGGMIVDIRSLGLDFALPGMFIALLVFQLKSIKHVLVALAAGLLSLILLSSGIQNWNVLIAACLAAGIGVVLCKCKQE